ncbi:hypothetical protein C0Q70_06871 [Pomacea canaliculata]|uniref:Chitin-binding type-2 domain-containing protein n=1 Tax=Pomacea canaliculata TaxID=400727 RepID=A0A2T7PDH7_POMCA|nr:chitin-binding domain protein cbd-1-like [Pomacea canaliculata]PVD31459.1 hypothetical protein C0Q70_06871 [Pomacea canaliculata]
MLTKLVVAFLFVCTARVIECEQVVYGYNVHLSTFDCTGQSDGIVEIGCDGYAECRSHQLVKTLCTDAEVFNRDARRCDPATATTSCTHYNICETLADGKYADVTNGCQSYYTCFRQIFYGHNYCPGGLVFDQQNQICNWASNVVFPCGTKTA